MRAEFAVFGIIAIVVVVANLLVSVPSTTTASALPNLGPAPELAGIDGWINSEPLAIESLKGKVVLVDFWTYSCINCVRTIPYINSWHEKYSGKGLVIIGVHTPEFEFEKDYNNVKAAVERYKIKYAVAQDNDYATWRAYKNSYWPRKYLIDKEGSIRYDHIGEGAYDETEKAIQELLGLRKNTTELPQDTNFSQIGTPEIYLGYKFARTPLGNPEGFSPGSIVDYNMTNTTQANIVYLSGQWKNEADRIISFNRSMLFLIYKAKNVNIVAGGNTTIFVMADGLPAAGTDGSVRIEGQMLYNIVAGSNYEPHLLEIAANPGFELYTFTFG